MATASTKVSVGDYEIDIGEDKVLGQGTYGTVFPGESVVVEEKVVGKRFLFEKDIPTDVVDHEAHVMLQIPDHENVVKRLDYLKKEVGNFIHVWLILEFCTLGPLGKYASGNALTLAQKVDLMLQGTRGLAHLHSNKLIHRDLKPDNILINGSLDRPIVKIADFGESKFLERIQEHSMKKMTMRGTWSYMAPELFEKTKDNKPAYNMKADVFSLGVSWLTLLEAEEGVFMQAWKGKFSTRSLSAEIRNINIHWMIFQIPADM